MSRVSASRFELRLLSITRWLTRHWLWGANLFAFAYFALALLAPTLMATGHTLSARIIYAGYSYLCHQWPDRSFFLYGPKAVYTLAELRAFVGTDVGRSYVGHESLGYKIAVCQRDLAMYAVILVGGLLYGVMRRRGHGVKMLRWWAALALLVPMAVDGGGQLLGFWESTWLVRSVTGGLVGVAWVNWVYSQIDEAVDQVAEGDQGVFEKGMEA